MTKEAAAQYEWPAGVLELINDEARTTGWHPWFSECPNDGNEYLFEVKSTADVNRLVRKLAAVKVSKKRVILSLGAEPRSIFTQQFPRGNDTGAVFLVGSQKILDDWFRQLPGGNFGVHHYDKAPEVQPPTLKLYVSNEAIELNKLEIPASIEVTWGYEPTPELTEMLAWEGSPVDRLMPDLQAAKDAVVKFIAAHAAKRKAAGIKDGPAQKKTGK